MIALKSRTEIERIREAGRVVAEAHRVVRELLQPGVTTGQLDAAVERLFAKHSAVPLFKGVQGTVPFPAVTCISVNEQLVHGIPGRRRLREGDIVTIDTGCRLNGWCADAAWTYPVGEVDSLKTRLLKVGEAVLETAIQEIPRRRLWSEVARLLAEEVERAGFSVVEDLVGHGIGREMHEDPQVPNFVSAELLQHDFRLRPGLVLAIEPMVNAGTGEVVLCEDHWTVNTEDELPCVHFEHTVALTEDGVLVMTEGVGCSVES